MIPQNIQALFTFIDYLDKNKQKYIEYIPLCNELKSLFYQRNLLRPHENYIDKQQYDLIQDQIKEKFSPITLNICTPILDKLKELGIWSGDEIYASIWNNNFSAIYDFKKDFKSEDISIVIQHKLKYVSFRAETNNDFLCLFMVFNELDGIFKELFGFFKDNSNYEFESFETKTIEVNSLGEALKSFKENTDKNLKFTIPFETLYQNPNKNDMQPVSATIKNELIMGDKIQIRDISNNSGQISIGKNKTKIGNKDELAKKTFNWQKWGIIITSILAIVAIIVAILLAN